MTDTKSAQRPRRDPNGRLATIGDLTGTALAGLVVGAVVLLVFEGILSLLHISEFGGFSGWLALILPVWLFTEEFRAEGWGLHRVIVAVLAAGFGVALGVTMTGIVAPLFPALVNGLAGAAVCTVVYCAIWFYGLRWLTSRSS